MTILIYGAGVLGSLYAVRLAEAGYDVTVLARSQRLADLRAHGIVLEDARTTTLGRGGDRCDFCWRRVGPSQPTHASRQQDAQVTR